MSRFVGGRRAGRGTRGRVVTALAAGLSISLLAACAQTDTGGGDASAAADSDVAEALQKEGEVVFMSSEGQLENGLQANLMAKVIEEFGGKAGLQPITDYTVMATAMSKADNMAVFDFWRWQAPDIWDKFVEKDKSLVEIGTTDYVGEEGWYVPTYVIKGDPERNIEPTCPGLPDWEALNDCVDVFATAKTGDKGQYMTGAESWAPFYGDQDRIDNLGLDYEMVFAGSEPALFAELKSAYDRGEPWLGLMWRPNYMTQIMDLTRVEFPEYSDECWAETHACQWPETVIYQLASSGFEEKYPTAWKIINNYEMPDEHLKELMSYVVDDGMDFPDAAQKWMDENPDVWKAWGEV